MRDEHTIPEFLRSTLLLTTTGTRSPMVHGNNVLYCTVQYLHSAFCIAHCSFRKHRHVGAQHALYCAEGLLWCALCSLSGLTKTAIASTAAASLSQGRESQPDQRLTPEAHATLQEAPQLRLLLLSARERARKAPVRAHRLARDLAQQSMALRRSHANLLQVLLLQAL